MPQPLIVSPAIVRRALAGPSMQRFILSLGETDAERNAEITRLIRVAQSWFETECAVHLFETRIVSRPVPEGMVRRTENAEGDYDKQDDAYTYHANDFLGGGTVQVRLRKRPVVSIEAVALKWGLAQDFGSGEFVRFPKGWCMAGAREGTLNIAALLNGGSATINTSLLMLPLAVGVMSRAAVPLLLHVNYTAGFLPYSFNPDTDDLGTACPDFENIHIVADGVRALTAIKILTNTRFAKGAGGGSIAVDGISQTHAPGRFAQEIATLGEDVKAAKSALSASMRGLNFMFA